MSKHKSLITNLIIDIEYGIKNPLKAKEKRDLRKLFETTINNYEITKPSQLSKKLNT